jgi:drug/metabolite transporter, DME family
VDRAVTPPAGRAGAGTAAILGAAMLWACIGVISVGIFAYGISPWEVAFWRAALAAALLLAASAALRRGLLRLPGGRDALLLGGFGVVGVGVFYAAFQLAIAGTSVAVAVVLLYTAPVWVLLGARVFLGEALGRDRLLTGALVVAGVWATALGAAGAEVRVTAAGVGWGLLSALAYATYYLFGRRYLPRYGIGRMLLVSLVCGTAVLGPAAALAGHPPRLTMPAGAWLLLLALALGATLLANALYYWGLARVEAGRAAMLASVEPVAAAVLALLLLGQGLTAVGWVGVGLVVAGVALVPAAARARRGLRAGRVPAGPASGRQR